MALHNSVGGEDDGGGLLPMLTVMLLLVGLQCASCQWLLFADLVDPVVVRSVAVHPQLYLLGLNRSQGVLSCLSAVLTFLVCCCAPLWQCMDVSVVYQLLLAAGGVMGAATKQGMQLQLMLGGLIWRCDAHGYGVGQLL